MTCRVAAFAPDGPLPQGVTLLEASAGTGKTHTIASLVVRYVAERGLPLEALLVVTFTRAATGELRERVRRRLLEAERALSPGAPAPPPEDEVLRLLAGADSAEVARRRDRIRRALADFDAATIATTHGFCQQVLEGLGVSGDVARDAVFAEDIGDLVGEVVDDLYVRRFHGAGPAPFSRGVAREVGRVAVENALAPLEPRSAPDGSEAAGRVAIAEDVRAEVERRTRRTRLLTYDDLLTRLLATLTDPDGGADACARLRERYAVALIDEFQDTDPVQWEIVRLAFGSGTLVLIGDPKQAIYSFRGADVHTYLRAAAEASTLATLGTNWRSDQALIDAYDGLFGRARLGHHEIPYRTVTAAAPVAARRLAGAPDDAPLRVRVVRRTDGLVNLTQYGYAQVASTREHVARDLAADAVSLLSSPARIVEEGEWADIRPGHLAVLVRTNRQASLVRDALAEVGVPAVINGAGSVFATRAADEWLRLLRAIEHPAAAAPAASAALTGFLGWTPARLAQAADEDHEELHALLHRLGGVLRRRGVAALLETIVAGEGLAARVLSEDGGERTMTDLRHVGQLLHRAAAEGRLGVSALAVWLAERMAEADADTAHEDRSRRLESDAEAVQVLTIHRAKGLEFPIVMCPFLWDPSWIPDPGTAIPVFHDPSAGDERTVDVGGPKSPGYAERYRLFRDEQRGEDLRLAYVALTRARHQAVIWWAGSYDSRDSALGRLLFATDAAGDVASEGAAVPADEDVRAAVSSLGPGCVSVAWTAAPSSARWSPPASAPADLAAARLERGVDAAWRRSSYSSIVAGVEDEQVASEPEEPPLDDEPGDAAASAGGEGGLAPAAAVGLPLADLPAGVELGSLVHAVMERADFAAADLEEELASLVAEEAGRRAVPITDPAAAADGLLAAIETPLGVGVRLRDIGRPDRLDELAFELPLVGGDAPTGAVRPGDIADLLERHLDASDPLAAYPGRLREPGLSAVLRGYLVGAIDLVARLPDGRFAVVDYKTNRLGAGPLSAHDYRPTALAAEMARAHYPLQALLYLVALHRYLGWRHPGYRPDAHLAGAGYLFLRGMVGPGTPEAEGGRCGVFWWRPPDGLVPALSELLAEGAT